MRIVLTNDDGIACEGLIALQEALKTTEHECYVLAPDGNRSGVSQSLTLHGPMVLSKRGERAWACSGTPSDCAILASLGALAIKPDLLISGINVGPNIGTDIIYSGTVAAARQAALHDIPAIALSLASHEGPYHWAMAASWFVERLDRFYALWMKDTLLNINIPNRAGGPDGWCMTWPSRRVYNDRLAAFAAPDQRRYFFIEGGVIETESVEGTDYAAVQQGKTSVSAVYIHPVIRRDTCDGVPDHAAADHRRGDISWAGD